LFVPGITSKEVALRGNLGKKKTSLGTSIGRQEERRGIAEKKRIKSQTLGKRGLAVSGGLTAR